MSETYQSLSHSKWDCQYHVVFVPKRVGNWVRFSTRWLGKRSARSWKAT
jgi:hypothetical protein